MSKRPDIKQRIDDHTTWRLINWARFIRADWKDGPRENAKGPSWHEQVEDGYRGEEPEPPPIDEDDAELVQNAMIAFMVKDIQAANVLIQHYRDGWFDGRENEAAIRKCRNMFWRFL